MITERAEFSDYQVRLECSEDRCNFVYVTSLSHFVLTRRSTSIVLYQPLKYIIISYRYETEEFLRVVLILVMP